MAESERTPRAAEAIDGQAISVDIKEANDATVSESQTTPTPSKTQFNANAVEFVPGQYSRPSSVPNPAAPVFTPSFQLTSNGYVPINPYAMPYYMYVPTNGAPLTNADGSIAVSPVLTYQTSAPYRGGYASMGKGGLARQNSSGARSQRSDSGRKDGFSKPYRAREDAKPEPEATVECNEPVVKLEDFPDMMGRPAAPSGTTDAESPANAKPSWASIAKKPNAAPVVAKEEPKAEQPVITPASPNVVPDPATDKPMLVVAKASEPPKEPVAGVVPATGKPKLAPWARAEEEQQTQEETIEGESAVDEAIPKEAEAVAELVEEEETTLTEPIVEPVEEGVGIEESRIEKVVLTIELMRRLRYHEECRPTAEAKTAIPNTLLRQRALAGSAEEAEDWRAEAVAFAARRPRRGLDRRQTSRIEISAEMLIPSENSWSVAQQKKDAAIDENVKVGRKIFAILNKLTVEKFAKLSDQLFTECGIAKPAHIITLVKYLFEKATIQHHFIPMYADLCNKCLAWLSSDACPEELIQSIGPGERQMAAADIFRRVLLERCQAAFYSYFLSHEDEAKKPDQEDAERTEEEHHKHRLSMLGTVKFVAQLMERRLMTRAVFRNCLDTLLNEEERTEDHVECACVFLGEIGRLFEKDEEAGETADQYSRALDAAMEELEDIAAEPSTSARIRFTIMNLVDLRSNKYTVKALPGQPVGPTKIAEVHKQAAKEEQLVRTMSRTQNQSSVSLVSDEWETVPKKVNAANLPPPTPTRSTSQAGNPWRMRKENSEAELRRSASRASNTSE